MNWNAIIQRLNELTTFKNNVEANSKKIPQLPTQTDGTKYVAAYNETSEVTEKFNLSEALAGLNTLTDGILEQGLITRDENIFTFEVGFEWRINGIDYANASNIDLTIEDATTDFYRIDIAVVDTNNLIYLIQGLESDAIPLQPQTPNDTLLLCVFNVFGNSIEDPLSITSLYKEVKLINYSEPYTLIQGDAQKFLVLESSYDVILPTGLFENPNFEIKNASGSSREITFDSNIVFIGNPIIPNGGLCLLKKIKNVGADEYWSVNVVDRESGNSEILEQWRRLGWSAGAISGFGITNNGDGTANIATGNALLRTSVSEIATLNEYVLPAVNNQTFTDNTTNYIYANYNSGTPIISVTTDSTIINTLTTTLIYGVVRQGTNLYYQSFISQNVDSNGKLRRRFIIMETFSRGQGAVISATNRKIALTAGSFFSGLTPITTPAFDTNVASTFTYVYFNGTNFTRTTGQTDINNSQYINAGTLTTMSNNHFRTDFVYLLIDNPTQLWVVQGNSEYGNLASAKLAPTPTNLPPELNGLGVIVGRVIIEKSATTLSDVASPFTTQFIAGSPTLHNQLGGLQGGTTNEYYHLTAEMHGYLDFTSSGQTQLNSKENIASAIIASGTDTYTATYAPSPTSYTTGFKVLVTFANTNTGASTINLNGLGAKSIVKDVSTPVATGDLLGSKWLVYNGTDFVALGISASGGTSYSDLFPIHLIYQEANGFLSIGTNVLSFSGTQSLLVISPILYRKIVSASTANSTTSIRESSFNRIFQNKGYYFEIRVKNEDASVISDVKYFYGLAETGTLGGNNPSTYTGSFIGMGSDNTDTNCCIYYKNFTTGLNTKIDLGASFPKSQTNEYLIKFYRLSGSNDTTYDIENLTTSATATGLISCNPSTLTIHTQRNNSASAIVCGYAIQRIKVFIED